MEWVDGEPLSSLRRAAAKSGGIPRSIALRVVADACSGLHAAHEMKDDGGQPVGLVHRDISPQNILITFGGDVKIVDFGVAKAAGRSTGQTIAGQVKGKPPYMSPEQALGEAVDRRTDIFALGIILYQLTTGKHPFRGESDLVTLQNIVSDKAIVSPRALDRQYPRELEQVVMKALDRKRERRYQTCAEFEAAIEDVFAKAVPRARNDEVGKFMQDMLGSRGEARRKALADSVRAADERTAGRGSMADISVTRGIEASSLTPTSGLMPAQVPDFGTDPRRAPVTPFDAIVPTRPSRRGKGTFVALALVIAFGGGAFFGFGKLGMFGGGTPEQTAHPAARPEARKNAVPQVAVATSPEQAETAPVATVAPDESSTATEAAAPVREYTKTHHNGALHSRPVAASTATAKPPITKPTGTSKPAAKSAFVPPPMSDPGF
jgi:serine/threonine-protein kinase